MNITTAIETCFAKYATFEGRASRAEFWWFQLFTTSILTSLWLYSLTAPLLGALLLAVAALTFVLPSLAVLVRRFHDTGRSGWWYVATLLPAIGGLIMLVFAVQKGTAGTNAYGPDPLAPSPLASDND